MRHCNDVTWVAFFRDMTLSWWRHQMETFSALLAVCAGNSPVPGEYTAQRTVTRSCDVFFDLCLNKRLSKQSWGWRFETLPHPLWRQCNVWGLALNSNCRRVNVWEHTILLQFLVCRPQYHLMSLWHHGAVFMNEIKNGHQLISPWTKWPPFHRWYFQMHFREWQVLYFNSKFTEVCSSGPNRQ